MTETKTAPSAVVEELDRALAKKWLSGIWRLPRGERPKDPKTTVQPYLWKWADIYDGLLQAREKIGIQQGNVELRFIRLGNPGCEKTEITTHTMLMSLLNYESWNSRPLWDKIKEVFTSPIKEQL
jgi:gentisate 1,2-dioxygenase